MLLQIDKQKGRDKIFLRFNAGVKVIGLMVKFLEEKVLFSKIIEPKDLDLPLLVSIFYYNKINLKASIFILGLYFMAGYRASSWAL